MAGNPKLKIKAATAQELCAQFQLSAAAKPHLEDGIAPLDFFDALVANEIYPDAVQFMARALPKREAVWWACLCAREAPPAENAPPLAAAIDAAESWVRRPSEETRRRAQKAAEAIEASHPARWAAMGAFWSGGSIAPPELAEVKPADDMTAKAVAGAVSMSAALDAKSVQPRYRRFLAYGRDIANGGTGRPAAAAAG